MPNIYEIARTVRDQMALITGKPTSGNIYYVSSTSSNKADTTKSNVTSGFGGRGKDPSYPFATLSYAVGQCTDNNGDIIVLMPGHAETVHTAAAIALSKIGVTVFGLGNDRNRPVLTWDATASTMTVTGANSTFRNVVFDFTGIDAVVVGISVDAAGVSFEECEFVTNGAAAGCVSGVTVGAATTSPRFRFINNRCRGAQTNSGTTTTAQLTLTDCPDYEIRDCFFTGKMTQAITNGSAILRGEITSNRFTVYSPGTKAINLHASSTASISNNKINVSSGVAPIVGAGAFLLGGNTFTNGAGVTISLDNDTNARTAFKAAATMVNGQTLFTVAGGPIVIEALVSICVTGNDGTASTLQYSATPTVGSAQTISGASASLASALAGASVTLAGTALATAALLNANGPNLMANPGTIMVPAGTITMVIGTGSTTGTWQHYLRYRPLTSGVTVS